VLVTRKPAAALLSDPAVPCVQASAMDQKRTQKRATEFIRLVPKADISGRKVLLGITEGWKPRSPFIAIANAAPYAMGTR
jgi:hypothetical protein